MTEVLLNRNQSIGLQSKLVDWFLYDRDLRRERAIDHHSIDKDAHPQYLACFIMKPGNFKLISSQCIEKPHKDLFHYIKKLLS